MHRRHWWLGQGVGVMGVGSEEGGGRWSWVVSRVLFFSFGGEGVTTDNGAMGRSSRRSFWLEKEANGLYCCASAMISVCMHHQILAVDLQYA